MSHELRTPLNVIKGYTEMLVEEKSSDDPDRSALEGIQQATSRLMALVESVLDLNQLRTGNYQITPKTFSLAEVFNEVVLAIQGQASRAKCSIVLRVEDFEVHTDIRMVRQILFNLADNAARFTHEGTVELVGAAVDDQWFEIIVSDTGIGMTPAQLDAATQPFWQADSTSTRRYDGAGVGLAVCKGLAEAMGGTLTIVSQWGKGAEVRVVLPRRTEEEFFWEDDEPTVLLR